MTDYRRCELCGSLVTVEGKPDFIGDEYPITLHYQPACDALVRELASVFDCPVWMEGPVEEARRLVGAMDND